MFRYPFHYKCAAVLLGLILSALAGEGLLRLVNYHYVPLEVKEIGQVDWRPYHMHEDEYFKFDAKLIWRPKKNYKIFNAHGFRGPLVPINKAPLEYRIVTLGDSNTLGPTEIVGWPAYLRYHIQTNRPHGSVINAGVLGYSSWQGLMRFKEILKYQPDVVLVSFGANDAHRVVHSDKEYISSKRFIHPNSPRFRFYELYIALNDIFLMKTSKGNALIPRVSLSDFEDNLKKMISLANQNNVRVVLLTRPFIGNFKHPLDWKNFGPQYNELTRKIAQEHNLGLIEVYSYFQNKAENFSDESHFNDAGNEVAGNFIYHQLMDLINAK